MIKVKLSEHIPRGSKYPELGVLGARYYTLKGFEDLIYIHALLSGPSRGGEGSKDLGCRFQSCFPCPEGPSTQYSRFLAPETILAMDFGARNLKYWVLSLGYSTQYSLDVPGLRLAVLKGRVEGADFQERSAIPTKHRRPRRNNSVSLAKADKQNLLQKSKSLPYIL